MNNKQTKQVYKSDRAILSVSCSLLIQTSNNAIHATTAKARLGVDGRGSSWTYSAAGTSTFALGVDWNFFSRAR